MQNYPTGWQEALNGLYRMETKAEINGVEYGERDIISASTRAALFSTETISIGSCVAKEIDLVIVPKGDIPRMAEIKMFVRPVADNIETAWLQKGVYYIDTRKEDLVYGTLTIHGYDAMLKAEQVYLSGDDLDIWPQSMREVAETIASRMGLKLDSRTSIREDFLVPHVEDYTLREVLGYIAVAHAGNWIITDAGDLRLVPLFLQGDEPLDIGVNATSLSASPPLPSFSGVTLWIDDETAAVSGDSTSRVLEANFPWATQAIADYVLAAVAGQIYQPFEARGAVVAAVAELGDPVVVGGVQSVVGYSDTVFDAMSVSDIGAPADEEVDHEYHYVSKHDRDIYRRFERVTEETLEKLDQEEIFNRLTKNGALQGLYMKDGQLYVNASFIKSGQILADLIKAGVIRSVDGITLRIDLDTGEITSCDPDNALVTARFSSGRIILAEYDPQEFAAVRLSIDGLDVHRYEQQDNGHFYPHEFLVSACGGSWGAHGESYIKGTTDEKIGAEAEVELGTNAGDPLKVHAGERNYISGLSAPVDDTEAANKKYVDDGFLNIRALLGDKAASNHTHTNVGIVTLAGDVLALALSSTSTGLTPVITNSASTNLPPFGSYTYADGYVLRRVTDQATIVLFDHKTGDMAINTYLSGAWSGWNENATTTYVSDAIRAAVDSLTTSTAAGQVCEFDSGAISITNGNSYYNSKDSKSKWYWIWVAVGTGFVPLHVDWKALTTSEQYIWFDCGADSMSLTVKKDSSNRLVVKSASSTTTIKRVVGYY